MGNLAFPAVVGGLGWSMQLAREWWDLHMPEVDELADLDRLSELSPDEIMRIEK